MNGKIKLFFNIKVHIFIDVRLIRWNKNEDIAFKPPHPINPISSRPTIKYVYLYQNYNNDSHLRMNTFLIWTDIVIIRPLLRRRPHLGLIRILFKIYHRSPFISPYLPLKVIEISQQYLGMEGLYDKAFRNYFRNDLGCELFSFWYSMGSAKDQIVFNVNWRQRLTISVS